MITQLLALILLSAAPTESVPSEPEQPRVRNRTHWVCHVPPPEEYTAYRCGSGPLLIECSNWWLQRCEEKNGTLEWCADHGCPHVDNRKRYQGPKKPD